MLEDKEVFTGQQIVKTATQRSGNNSEESKNEQDGTIKQSVSHADTAAAFNVALTMSYYSFS